MWDCYNTDTSRRPREGEENGLDYHFAMRIDMEEDIRQNRFLEYGEYADNLYGTTYDAIREVNRSGKMCILDINPQVCNTPTLIFHYLNYYFF